VDANFTNLNTDKAELSGADFTGDSSFTGSSSGSTVLTLTSNALADTPLMVFERTGGAVAGKLAYEDTNTAIAFGTTTQHELKFLTNNTARGQFTGNGNLLLQTDTVAYAGTALNIGDTSDSQNGVQITTSTTGNGYILFGDGSGADSYRGQIHYQHSDDTLKFNTAGTVRAKFGSSEIVFNDVSADTDFRVESNTQTHMLFVDAGANSVGINNSAPSGSKLSVLGASTAAVGWGDVSDRGFLSFDGSGNPIVRAGSSLDLKFQANSSRDVATFGQTATVFNEPGNDQDFRVESDTNANAFFLDATNGNIGMGGTSNVPLNIFRNGAGNTELLRLTNNNTNNHNFYVYVNDDDNMVRFGSTGDNGGNFAILESTNTNDSIIFYTAGGATFNELGADSDFRVESNNSAYAVYVDAAQDSVGILTNATDAALNVNSQNSSKDAIRIVGSGGNNFITGYGNQGNIAFDISEVGAEDPGKIRLYNNGGAVHQISAKASEGVMFNDGGMDMDFRVESDNRSHMLFVDAGSDSVTIGNTPYSVYSKSPQFGVNYGLAPWMSVGNASDGLVVLGSGGIGSPSVGSQDYMAYLAHNAFRDTDGAFLPIRTGAIGKAVLKISGGGSSGDVSTGGMFLDYAAAGSGSISWTRLMSVDGSTKSLVVNQGGATFNEAGNDSDFRVESNSNTHMLFVDGSNNSVSIGTANDYTGMLNLSNAYGDYCVAMQDDEVNTAFVLFRNNSGTSVGSILRSGTSTNYNTTSDARLKENIADADDAGELIDAIQVRQFDWITDGEHQRYGMVAQELNTVAPEAVSEGNAEEDMMGVDYSKLVPMLIKEIQSLRARVAQLESN
jgi:hypothetical protein